MTTQQQQDILDNAPEGATHYKSGNYYMPSIDGYTYLFFSHGVGHWEKSRNKKERLANATPLAGLRKKQQPTVFDAVDALEGGLLCDSNGLKQIAPCWSITGNGIEYRDKLICTHEEFNQCVDDLAKYRNKQPTINSLHAYRQYEYAQHKLDNPQPKPRTKVEYKEVNESNCCVWDLKGMLERELLYTLHGDVKYLLCSNNAPMHMLICFDEGRVYRKVETEIDEKQDQIDEISKLLTMNGFAHDPIWIKCIQSHGHLAKIKQGE
jgi:hypothetical protein